MHNLFGTLYQRSINRVFEQDGKRSYHTARNSHALAAPYPFVIPSDLYDHRDFIRGVVNMGFSGLLWVPEVRDAADVEDLIRRIQSVVLSPMALINVWGMPNPPWLQVDSGKNHRGEFMEDAQQTTDMVRKVLSLRMQLLPYIYSAFAYYRETGVPPFRALVMDYPLDAEVRAIDDEYMVGDALLFAPLVRSDHGTRKVYLPEGCWRNYFTGEQFQKGWHTLSAGLDSMLLFVKDHSLIPVADTVDCVREDTVFTISFRAYGEGGTCLLYEDDGETTQQAHNWLSISYDGELVSCSREGDFAKTRYRIAQKPDKIFR